MYYTIVTTLCSSEMVAFIFRSATLKDLVFLLMFNHTISLLNGCVSSGKFKALNDNYFFFVI